MRTLIVSDLHLGNGGGLDIFAGEDALPPLLAREAARADGGKTRVILNGDCADFLLNEDPLTLDEVRAVEQARDICGSRATKAVLRAFGDLLAAGGEVVFRLGNHDVELGLPAVQAVFRDALGQPPSVAARLSFQLGDAPSILEVGGARIVVTHGEHADQMNRIEYSKLLDGTPAVVPGELRYPPGSRLVKSLMNPLKLREKMRYMDLLKPDVRGAVLTALAANPAATKVLLSTAGVRIVGGWLLNLVTPSSFTESGEIDEIGFQEALIEARKDLTEAEAQALAAL
ncbi:MAG: hypothetical protein R3F14_17640, partial [Polyangiaceae bacterium]